MFSLQRVHTQRDPHTRHDYTKNTQRTHVHSLLDTQNSKLQYTKKGRHYTRLLHKGLLHKGYYTKGYHTKG